MKTKTEILPKKIREERLALGLSQEELAQEIGVSFTTVNRWENGKAAPSKLAMTQLTRIFSGRGRKKDGNIRNISSDILQADEAMLSYKLN